MAKQIFVNLPVADLEKSKEFFKSLGYTFNPQFSDENGACMIINDGSIYAMLLTHKHFKEFTSHEIADSSTTKEVLTALALDSRQAVDEMHNKAITAGGKLHRESDLGFMYTKAIEDLDGHVWEFFHMDMSQMPSQ